MFEHQMFPSQMRRAVHEPAPHQAAVCAAVSPAGGAGQGQKPSVLPVAPFKPGPSEFKMSPLVDGAEPPVYPIVLVMVEATELKHFANWEVEHVEAMIDYLLECEQDKKETRH